MNSGMMMGPGTTGTTGGTRGTIGMMIGGVSGRVGNGGVLSAGWEMRPATDSVRAKHSVRAMAKLLENGSGLLDHHSRA